MNVRTPSHPVPAKSFVVDVTRRAILPARIAELRWRWISSPSKNAEGAIHFLGFGGGIIATLGVTLH
jgi:hypothetical protein